MRKLTFILVLFVAGLPWLTAQDILLRAEYPSVVRQGQQFNITWSVNANGGDFNEPSFEGFYKLIGPSTSYSSSTQIINGRVTRSATNSFTFIIQAMEPGNYTIPPASYVIDNDIYESAPLQIEVIASNTSSSPGVGTQTPQESTTQNPSSSRTDTDGVQLFLDLIVDKTEVYVGQPILATAKIYTQVSISGINDVKYPSFNNFIKTDLETPPLNSLVEENVNGAIYGTGVLQQFLLYPQVSGEILIEPMQVTALQQQRIGSTSGFDSFFSDFFSSYQNVPVALTSDPVTVNVKPLPANRPADFSGIVGSLEMRSGIDKDTVNVNDAITMNITISGNGNIRMASTPELDLVPDIEQYDPDITDDIRNSANGASGSRTFEFLLIPRYYGDYFIPPVSYSYFDPSSGKYEYMETPEYHFYANRVDETSSDMMVYSGVSREDVRYVGQDIRFIKDSPGKLKRSNTIKIENGSFLSMYAFSLIFFLILLFVRREHVRRNADITTVKNRKAGKVATKRLKVASECLSKNEMDRFYEEVLKALMGYLGDKLSISLSSLNRTNIIDKLKGKGVGDDKIDELNTIIDTCEFARYSPSSSEAEATELYGRTSGFIKFVEGSVKR